MPQQPSLVVYDLGPNRHNQAISVRIERGLIFVEKAPASQRDDAARFEIGAGQLRMLVELAGEIA